MLSPGVPLCGGRPVCRVRSRRLPPAGNQDREGIAGLPGADRHFDILKPGIGEKGCQPPVGKAQGAIPEAIADPCLPVLAEIENQHAPARHEDADGLPQRARGLLRVVESLGEQRQIHARVPQRQLLERTPLPDDIGDLPA